MKTRTDLTSSWWNFPLNESVLKFTEKEGRSESEKTGSALPDQSTVRKLERNLKPKGTGDQELPEVKFSLPNGRSLSWDKRLWRQPVRVWGLFSLSTWHGIHVYPVTNLLVADHDWSPTLPDVTVLATATELLPQGRRHNSNLAANNTLSLPEKKNFVRGCFCWALPLLLFALLLCWMAKRISGWGICVFAFCGVFCLCFFCKDRALERDRPYQSKRKAEMLMPHMRGLLLRSRRGYIRQLGHSGVLLQ